MKCHQPGAWMCSQCGFEPFTLSCRPSPVFFLFPILHDPHAEENTVIHCIPYVPPGSPPLCHLNHIFHPCLMPSVSSTQTSKSCLFIKAHLDATCIKEQPDHLPSHPPPSPLNVLGYHAETTSTCSPCSPWCCPCLPGCQLLNHPAHSLPHFLAVWPLLRC